MARPVPIFIWVVKSTLLVFILVVPVHTQGPVASCVPEIKVRKNTVYESSRERRLNIPCPVTYCAAVPAVAWMKIDETSKYIPINETNHVSITQEETGLKNIISYLSFRDISTHSNGVYRCKIFTGNFSLESHNININVSDSSYLSANNSTGFSETKSDVSWLLYAFICLGILGLVVTVMMISFLCINICSRKAYSRRHKNAVPCLKPRSAPTSGKSQEIPEEQNNIYDVPTDDVHSELDSWHAQNDQECTSDMRNGYRSSDGSQQIVYATLQHPTARGPPATRHQSREHLSEYASIRIS
ncbi:B- and T-lymphocyte attenuator-like [Clarias gariepinus]|uniref:B- and T-lymphocyte attenuator-like n=1 Tax=Clarias gariepinus TaxID=13013 RepID=UPI00234DFC9F|nr:B- and T-lymphocyte attenuator-like [Clarias gariepinus]